MDIDRVRYFQAFAETGSLVRAAELLHLLQPALSKALRLLEREAGVALLESDGRGLRLTEAGRHFQRETAPLLERWLGLPERLRSAATENPVRLGTFEVFSTYFLGSLLTHVNLSALEVHEFAPGHLEEAIAAGEVDLGITYGPVPKAGVEFVEITKIRMGAFGLKSFAREEDSEKFPFVIPLPPTRGTPSKMVGLDGWPDHRFKRLVKFRVSMMESALELCRGGHAVAYLPEFVVALHNESTVAARQLRELACPVPKKDRVQSVFLVRRAGAAETPTERQIARSLRALK